MRQFKTGTVEGTGSAINVSLGFKPDHVKCVNIDDAGSLAPMMEWINGMGAAAGIKSLSIADDGSTSNASHALVSSNGISQYDGSDSAAPGFTIGADSDLNASGETIVYIATRE